MKKAAGSGRSAEGEAGSRPAPPDRPGWTFLTNHAHVLLCLYRQPAIRLRDVAAEVGITERMVQKIVADLAAAGYLVVQKEGRCNRYRLRLRRRLRHPLEARHAVGRLLELLQPGEGGRT